VDTRPGKALVTGGAGFIGSHLCELLLQEAWEVYCLDDLSTGRAENIAHLEAHPRFHLVVESVLSPAVVNELVYKCDVVYHLAAAVGVRLIVERPFHSHVTNVEGTANVLDHCARFGKRVLVASSSEVYGNHPGEQELHETAQRIYGPTTATRWAYAAAKAIDEFLALARSKEDGLDCVIVRLFNTVGPRQSPRYGNVIPTFVSNALAERPLEVHGDGTQVRCFCHVLDTIRALKALMDDRSTSGEILNVGSNSPIRILDLAEHVRELTASRSKIVFVPYDEVYGHGIEDMQHRAPSIEKIRGAIGWEPTLGLERILADVISHVATGAPDTAVTVREPAAQARPRRSHEARRL
jgi:UDP-glucose 4-epimerase